MLQAEQAELLPFGDAEVLQHLPDRSALLEAGLPKAPSIPSADGGQGVRAPCTLQLQTARTNLIIRSYL